VHAEAYSSPRLWRIHGPKAENGMKDPRIMGTTTRIRLQPDGDGVDLNRRLSRIQACTRRNPVGVRRGQMELEGGRGNGH
jgi:hypothetical protein